jgi:hypothetical protein
MKHQRMMDMADGLRTLPGNSRRSIKYSCNLAVDAEADGSCGIHARTGDRIIMPKKRTPQDVPDIHLHVSSQMCRHTRPRYLKASKHCLRQPIWMSFVLLRDHSVRLERMAMVSCSWSAAFNGQFVGPDKPRANLWLSPY